MFERKKIQIYNAHVDYQCTKKWKWLTRISTHAHSTLIGSWGRGQFTIKFHNNSTKFSDRQICVEMILTNYSYRSLMKLSSHMSMKGFTYQRSVKEYLYTKESLWSWGKLHVPYEMHCHQVCPFTMNL